jgi:hypothetical protein
MKTGDRITVTAHGKTLPGSVVLASSNEMSLYIEFDGSFPFHIGAAPLLKGRDGVYRSIVDDTEMTVRPLA